MIGTIVCGPVAAKDAGIKTRGLILAEGGAPEFTFWAWDVHTAKKQPFSERLLILQSYANASGSRVVMVPWVLVNDKAELAKYTKTHLEAGFSAVINQRGDDDVNPSIRTY